MAHNAAVDHLRRSRSVPCEEVRPVDTRADQTGRECAASLREAFAALPADQRDVVVLRHVVGLTSEEIAGVLGRSVGSCAGSTTVAARRRAPRSATWAPLPAIRPPLRVAAVPHDPRWPPAVMIGRPARRRSPPRRPPPTG